MEPRLEQFPGPPHNRAIDFDPTLRLYHDTTTWLAEVLDGSMRTPFEYKFDGAELYGQDGGALKPIFEDAITSARKLGPNLWFEIRRRQIEWDEYRDMLAMSRNDQPNTMVVVSDFPPELMNAKHDIGGYNVSRKQTMIRVIAKYSDGQLRMISQSLDGSDRVGLEAIYHKLGFTPDKGELLGQRMHLDLSDTDQVHLIDRLVNIYDQSLSDRFGGYWHAGRQSNREINTYDFVLHQQDLLNAFLIAYSTDRKLGQSMLYGLAAAIQDRFEKTSVGNYNQQLFNISGNALGEILYAGQAAQKLGKSYSGCGISIGPNEQTSTEDEMNTLGYGNKADRETKYKFDKEMHCVVCQSPPKKDERKKKCGPCGICESCDTKIRKRNLN